MSGGICARSSARFKVVDLISLRPAAILADRQDVWGLDTVGRDVGSGQFGEPFAVPPITEMQVSIPERPEGHGEIQRPRPDPALAVRQRGAIQPSSIARAAA